MASVIPAAENFSDIARRMRELRQEQGLSDNDPLTASGRDLDAIGAVHGLKRETAEGDLSFRAKVMITLASRAKAWGVMLRVVP